MSCQLPETQTIISWKCVAILFVADFLHALGRFASRLGNGFGRCTTRNQSSFRTETILPAGSLNQAVVGPHNPFLVHLQVTLIVMSNRTPRFVSSSTARSTSSTRKIQDSEGLRNAIRLRINKNVIAAGQMQCEQ